MIGSHPDGPLPRTRPAPPAAPHPAPRRRRPPLPRGADGGGGLLVRLLAALPPRGAVRDHRQPGVGAARPVAHAQPPAQAAPPQAPRPVPETGGGRCPVEGRRLVLGNNDVRITYVVTGTDPSPLYRNAIGDECVYVESGTGTVETVFGVVPYRAGDYVLVPRATDHRWVPAEPSPALRDRGQQPHPPAQALPLALRPAPRARAVLRARPPRPRPRPSRSRAPTSRCWSSTAPAPASSAAG